MTTQASTKLGGMHIIIILLTLATSLVHFWLGLMGPGVDILFTLNGLGYLTLAVVGYVPIAPLAKYQTPARWALVVFAAATILGWIFLNGLRIPLGYITKAIEVVLIVLVVMDLRKK